MVEILDYNELFDEPDENIINTEKILKIIDKSFGKTGSGILLIKNTPNLESIRNNFFTNSQKFINLNDDIKEKYTDMSSNFNFGWSRGKEHLKKNQPDTLKGSFYNNPFHDKKTHNYILKKKYPTLFNDNIWPGEDDAPGFEKSYKILGQLMCETMFKLIKYIDVYLNKITDKKHEINKFYNLVTKSKSYKSRYLYYYPPPPNDNDNDNDSCAWHSDHGFLTSLCQPKYFNAKMPDDIIDSNNIESGLEIIDTQNNLIKINIPENHLAIQIGETLQILSNGFLKATPHHVITQNLKNISRNQFVTFCDIPYDYSMEIPDYGNDKKETLDNYININKMILNNNIVKLSERYENCTYYHDFTNNCIKTYYK